MESSNKCPPIPKKRVGEQYIKSSGRFTSTHTSDVMYTSFQSLLCSIT
jgi:hypothetical protein